MGKMVTYPRVKLALPATFLDMVSTITVFDDLGAIDPGLHCRSIVAPISTCGLSNTSFLTSLNHDLLPTKSTKKQRDHLDIFPIVQHDGGDGSHSVGHDNDDAKDGDCKTKGQ